MSWTLHPAPIPPRDAPASSYFGVLVDRLADVESEMDRLRYRRTQIYQEGRMHGYSREMLRAALAKGDGR